ncbi:MAG: hypothetical protein ACXWZ4_01345 [Gemmatirosa sp.]
MTRDTMCDVLALLSEDVAADAAALSRLIAPAQRVWRPHRFRASIARHASAASLLGERCLLRLERSVHPSAARAAAQSPAHPTAPAASAWVAGRLAARQWLLTTLAHPDPTALEALVAQQARVQRMLTRLARAHPREASGGASPQERTAGDDLLPYLAIVLRLQQAGLARAVALTAHPRFPGAPLLELPG